MVQFGSGFSLYPSLGRGLLARLALRRGQLPEAVVQADAAGQFFLLAPPWPARVAPVQIQALLTLGRPTEALAVAELVLGQLAASDGFGVAEVEFRFSASLALMAAGQPARAHSELQATLRLIHHLADDIRDPFWRNSYLSRNRSCVRAQQLAIEWGVDRGEQEPAGAGGGAGLADPQGRSG